MSVAKVVPPLPADCPLSTERFQQIRQDLYTTSQTPKPVRAPYQMIVYIVLNLDSDRLEGPARMGDEYRSPIRDRYDRPCIRCEPSP